MMKPALGAIDKENYIIPIWMDLRFIYLHRNVNCPLFSASSFSYSLNYHYISRLDRSAQFFNFLLCQHC